VPDLSWEAWRDAEASAIREGNRWREMTALEGLGPRFVLPDGRKVVSFASNDYLGLTSHPSVIDAAREAAAHWGTGAGASRLVVGSRDIHAHLEAALASWRGAESALVLPSGYQANLAVLAAFGQGARIVSDETNHASIIDGARLARAEVAVYRHADVGHAEDLVRSASGRVIVVSDTVFSMDGDVAPVDHLSKMCARRGALLVLDDAHAVFDVEPLDPDALCLRVGTLSKALGSQGGYITGPHRWVEMVVNRARSFIFTTALAPNCAAAALASVEICRSEEGASLRQALRRNIDALRPGHPTPIIPVVLGSEQAALDASRRLLEEGLLVPAIRPPTVPEGTSRLRVALSAAHEPSDVEHLAQVLPSP